MRTASVKRETKETKVNISLGLDGSGKADIATGCGFLDHMLELFARHGDFDLEAKCLGDTHVDYHHTVEDVGISLGKAFAEAMGDKRGISRYGQFFMPMDETLMLCVCDISGRDCLGWAVDMPAPQVGDFDSELSKEFWLGFIRNCPMAMHFRMLAGDNTHHVIEAMFKGMARALKQAVAIDGKHADEIPSTKGVL